MGVDTEAVLSSLDDAISKITKVGGGGAELDKIYVCADCQRVLENAEKLAKSEGDEYVSVEHIAMAIFDLPTQAIRDIFRIRGITKAAFKAELAKVKTARVTDDEPEQTYDALKNTVLTLSSGQGSRSLTPLSAGTPKFVT